MASPVGRNTVRKKSGVNHPNKRRSSPGRFGESGEGWNASCGAIDGICEGALESGERRTSNAGDDLAVSDKGAEFGMGVS